MTSARNHSQKFNDRKISLLSHTLHTVLTSRRTKKLTTRKVRKCWKHWRMLRMIHVNQVTNAYSYSTANCKCTMSHNWNACFIVAPPFFTLLWPHPINTPPESELFHRLCIYQNYYYWTTPHPPTFLAIRFAIVLRVYRSSYIYEAFAIEK